LTSLCSRQWPEPILGRFLNGWRATHGTAMFVSALIVRIMRETPRHPSTAHAPMVAAARELGEIISEDIGLDDTPHQELFDAFADRLIPSGSWRLLKGSVAGCNDLREYVKSQRLQASIRQGILTTMASECWNSWEYEEFARLARPWMTHWLGMDASAAENALKYVLAHTGNTEKGHFLHALSAWEYFCEAEGIAPDPAEAGKLFEQYLQSVGRAFSDLGAVLGDTTMAGNFQSD
jgi:hypothetical protein